MRVSIISCVLLCTLLCVTESIKCYMGGNGDMVAGECPTTNYCLIISTPAKGTLTISSCNTPDLEALKPNPTEEQAYFMMLMKYLLNEISGSTECESVMKKSASITYKGQSVTVYAACCNTDLCNSAVSANLAMSTNNNSSHLAPTLYSLLTVAVVTLLALFLR